MKTKSLFFIGLSLLFMGLLFIASCAKKDNDDGGGGNPNEDPEETFDHGSISMNINATSWMSNSEDNYILVTNDLFSILASDDNSSLLLYGSPFMGEGLYSFSGNPARFALFSDLENLISYMDSANGSITVSNYDAIEHRLSGSFDVEGSVLSDPIEVIEITDGEFLNVPIQFSREQDPSVISFKIDGNTANLSSASSTTLPQDESIVISYDSSEDDYYGDLAFPYTLDPGTYDYNLTSPGFIRFWYKFMIPISGSLTITVNDKVNHHIEGNFHCGMQSPITMESANITDGSFSIDY